MISDMTYIKTYKGFSLLEVLISLIILSVGLLGLAAMQAGTLKMNHGAYQRTQATLLAYDMLDRMRANRTAALAGFYDLDMGDDAPTPGDLATTDVEEWLNDYVSVLLTDGDGEISCDAVTNVCTVEVQWDEARMGGSSTDVSTETGTTLISFTFSAQI